MHLVLVPNAWEKRVAEDPVHDVKERVQNPRLLAAGKELLNITLHELVLVGRLGVGMRANSNRRVEPLIRYTEQIMNSFHVAVS